MVQRYNKPRGEQNKAFIFYPPDAVYLHGAVIKVVQTERNAKCTCALFAVRSSAVALLGCWGYTSYKPSEWNIAHYLLIGPITSSVYGAAIHPM